MYLDSRGHSANKQYSVICVFTASWLNNLKGEIKQKEKNKEDKNKFLPTGEILDDNIVKTCFIYMFF